MNADRSPTLPLVVVPGGARSAPENPLLLIRRYLRGRYIWAVALGATMSIPCAIVGYVAVPPVYESSGIVHVAPTMPKILYENELNQPMPMFDSFVSAQGSYLKSRRVLDSAANDKRLLEAGWPAGPAGLSLLLKKVDVQIPRGSELVQVSVKHPDARLAQAAVTAVLDAYDALKDELNGLGVESRELALVQRAKDLDLELKGLRQQVLQLAEVHGTDDLDAMHSMKLEAIARIDASIGQLDMDITRAGGVPGQPAAKGNAPVNADPVDLMALAARDPTLRGLLEQQDHLRLEIKSLSGKLSPAHREMMDLTRRLDAVDGEVVARAALDAKVPRAAAEATSVGPVISLEQLQASREALSKLRDKTLEEMKSIGETRMGILALREKAADKKRDLE